MEQAFETVKAAKPDASRVESPEIYFYAQGFKREPLLFEDLSAVASPSQVESNIQVTSAPKEKKAPSMVRKVKKSDF